MNLDQLINQFELVTDTEEGLEQLRSIILDLAVRGKLTTQNKNDINASILSETIKWEREELYEKGEIRKQSDLPEITEGEVPYELPHNWTWERLGNVGIVNPRLDADEDLEASFVPMKLISEDYSGRHDFEVRMWADIRRGYTHFGENDVGMAKITPCFENGKAAIFRNLKNGIGAGTTELYVFRAIPETILPEYVYSFIQSARFKALGKEKMTGTAGQQRVPRDYFEGALFPLPPIEEQQRIVQKIGTLFSQVDELEQKFQQDREVDERLQVAVLDDLQSAETPEASRQSWQRLTDHFEQIYRKPEHIDQLKQAILNEAVRGRLVPQEQDSDGYFNSLKDEIDAKREELSAEGERRIKKGRDPVQQDEHLWKVPNHWRWLRFQDFILFIDYRGKTPDKTESGIRLITAKNIRSGYIDFDPAEYIAEEDYDDWMTRGIPEKGDLLFTTEAPLGKIAVIDFEEKFALAQRAINFRLLGEVDPYFIQYFIMSNIFQDVLLDKATGMTATGIKSTILKKTPFPVPPLEEQKSIVRKIDELFSWCDELKEKLNRSQQTDQRLLDALVNGALEDDKESKESEEATISEMPQGDGFEIKELSDISTTDVQAGIIAKVTNVHEKNPKYKGELGHVKAEKICHIVESHIGIELGRKPQRLAAGPADFTRLKKVEHRAKMTGWFTIVEKRIGYSYKSGRNIDKIIEKLDNRLGSKRSKVDELINLFLPMDKKQSEIVATLYAAWNDLLAMNKKPTDDDIVNEASTAERWAAEKEKINKQKFYKALEWMKEKGLIPTGIGKVTEQN